MTIVHIETIKDLEKMKYIIESRDTPDYIFELENDLDLKGVCWTPFMYLEKTYPMFTGIFNGNNHIIKNLIGDFPEPLAIQNPAFAEPTPLPLQQVTPFPAWVSIPQVPPEREEKRTLGFLPSAEPAFQVFSAPPFL
jgi:hypothetical protein